MKKKIYILTSNFSVNKNHIKKIFSNKNFLIINACKGSKYSESEIVKKFNDAYGIIAGTEKYSKLVINNLKELKFISRCGVGVDNIDLEELNKKKIKLITTKNSHIKIVAEHSIAGLFCALKKIIDFNFQVKQNIWKKEFINTLYYKKIGFYGYGKVAQQIKKNLETFKADFYYYDINKNYKNSRIKKVTSLKKLFSKVDIVFICASLTNNNKCINSEILKHSKKNNLIINTSRGELINDYDLIKYLKKNTQSYYFADVFTKEPYYGPLLKLKNTIFTPHVSTYEYGFRLRMEIEALINLSKIVK